MSAEVLQKLDQIEAEMRRLGWWSDAPDFAAAIRAGNIRSYVDAPSLAVWLQGLFLPNARAGGAGGKSAGAEPGR